MNALMLFFVPVVRRICPLLTVRVENDLKSSSNLVDVLSVHDSKSLSNTYVEILSDFVKSLNMYTSSTLNITNASLMVWLDFFGDCVIIFIYSFCM